MTYDPTKPQGGQKDQQQQGGRPLDKNKQQQQQRGPLDKNKGGTQQQEDKDKGRF